MADWRTILSHVAYNVEEHFDHLMLCLKQRLGLLGPIQILPYRGHGSREEIHLRGRVLENKGITLASDNDTVWENIVAVYKRFDSVEIPGVRVRTRFAGVEKEVVTNTDGYFTVHLPLEQPVQSSQLWHPMELELLDQVVDDQPPVRTQGQVLIPPDDSAFAVISDIDDTIIESHAGSLLKMARVTFLNNARTRLPFKGVAAFYAALQQGGDGTGSNPIFYVSRTMWNLYDLLEEFIEVHGIPMGPLILRDARLDMELSHEDEQYRFKLKEIRRLLQFYPDLSFILIGDSGQRDPIIYQQIAKDFPERVAAIYIRNVAPEQPSSKIQSIIDELRTLNIEMLLVKDTEEAAQHALQNGFIHSDALASIHREKRQDEQAPTDLELLLDQV